MGHDDGGLQVSVEHVPPVTEREDRRPVLEGRLGREEPCTGVKETNYLSLISLEIAYHHSLILLEP